ncbi:MAG: LPP20 family lipoprotein [Nitrospira sp.]|nr:LPP20 family lipoprotein [Nitrospira sp.]
MVIRSIVATVCVGSFLALCVPPVQASEPSDAGRMTTQPHDGMYVSERYVIGNGYGDMTKGAAVCRRVAELSARAAVAKQIRVLVKERMIDRVRERSGRDLEQDIELTREEIVQEYLRGVTIVDYRIDETRKTCSATAVMLKE